MKLRFFSYKIDLLAIFLLFFVLILGCQPSGGELLPIGDNGVQITSSRFENDTVVISQNDITVKCYGSWDGNGNFDLRVIVTNSSAKTISIIFDKFIAESSEYSDRPIYVALKQFDGDVLISTDRTYENYDGNKQPKIPAVDVQPGDRKSFVVGFQRRFGSGEKKDSPNRLVNFGLPIQVNKTLTSNFRVRFKGISEESGHYKTDPTD